MLKVSIVSLCVLCGAFVGFAFIWGLPWGMSLDRIHSGIQSSYKNVQHVSADDLSEMDMNSVIIFDVRESAEYDVSHIQGALHIDPNVTPDDFEHNFSDKIKNKTVIFYCSVGVRSSSKASELDNIIKRANVVASYNLTGGLFYWHNQSRPVVQGDNRATEYIHPYNDYWGRLITHSDAISYEKVNGVN